jgi:hypothetical protein
MVSTLPLSSQSHHVLWRLAFTYDRVWVAGWPESKLGGPPSDKAGQEAMLSTLQDRKTDIYKDMIRGGTAKVSHIGHFQKGNRARIRWKLSGE